MHGLILPLTGASYGRTLVIPMITLRRGFLSTVSSSYGRKQAAPIKQVCLRYGNGGNTPL